MSLQSSLQRLKYRFFPALFWGPYSRKARAIGFDQLHMVLSFDCDTDEDIPAAKQIHDWLKQRGYNGVFAVPGAQVMKGAETFRAMANEGAEFINHGAKPHTEWREGRYWSITFYEHMKPAEVVEDIRLGHEQVAQATGRRPEGFRAPHFGHFQKPAQLELIYKTLRQLGYGYASTTTPQFMRHYGPIGKVSGIREFPVTGQYRNPLGIFDSWGSIENPYSRRITNKYRTLFEQNIDDLTSNQVVGLFNHYVDPAHVASTSDFFESISYALDKGVKVVTYTEILDRLKN